MPKTCAYCHAALQTANPRAKFCDKACCQRYRNKVPFAKLMRLSGAVIPEVTQSDTVRRKTKRDEFTKQYNAIQAQYLGDASDVWYDIRNAFNLGLMFAGVSPTDAEMEDEQCQ